MRHAPTLATTFLGCRQAAAWDIAATIRRTSPLETKSLAAGVIDAPNRDPLDAMGRKITQRGHEHEAGVLDALRTRFGSDAVVVIRGGNGDWAGARRQTDTAMAAGTPVIHQAALEHGAWYGHADFLLRVEEACASWAWSYEPWDAKLARNPRPKFLLQLCLYADMLDGMQGGAPREVGLMLGAGPETIGTHEDASFQLAEFHAYAIRVAERLERFAKNIPADLEAEPCGACDQCHYTSRCTNNWEIADHLSRVAGITGQQTRRLRDAGIPTMAALAGLADFADLAELADLAETATPARPAMRIAGHTLDRLAHQAALQVRTDAMKVDDTPVLPLWDVLDAEPGRGFDRLPAPDLGDVYFDYEGDPLEPGGHEYLCGVLVREGAAAIGEPVPDHPGYRFHAFWARDKRDEKAAFEALMDVLVPHLARYPGAHLYHYAPYEKSAMGRLAGAYATREAELDTLFRTGRLVDLYRVVREGVRVGARSYSIKKLEPLYMAARTTDVMDGGDSIVMIHRYKDEGDGQVLADIELYNRDDCVSTVLLHDWLVARAQDAGRPAGSWSPAAAEPEGASDEPREAETDRQREAREKREAYARCLADQRDAAGADLATATPSQAVALSLARDLTGYFEREDKPAWWAFFERAGSTHDDLIDDVDCLARLEKDRSRWGVAEKRSSLYRFRVPAQDAKLNEGDSVYFAADPQRGGQAAGTVHERDEANGTVTLKIGPKVLEAGPPPSVVSLMPQATIDKEVVKLALLSALGGSRGNEPRYPHIARFLAGEPPRLKGREPGLPVIADATQGNPAKLLQATIKAALALDASWLCIQGPPGAGKTYTIARVIAALTAAGRTVGVSSNSHKAIDNVLYAVEDVWEADNSKLKGQKKDGGDGYEGTRIASVSDNKAIDWTCPLVAGTAWLFSREEARGQRDVLIVDEAGQVGLASLLAMATASRSIILVGDQMQLPQVVQGSHPGRSGLSCLEHALSVEGGDPALPPAIHAVVLPDRGIFLGTTWRMHPELTRFVSETIYDGRLEAHPRCAAQALHPAAGAHPALKAAGLSFVELAHSGNAQTSEEEAGEIARLYADLLAARVTSHTGATRPMTPDDILVVAPYNMQVRLLARRLSELAKAAGRQARVGTVDKFQGQEAEVVLVSMATSDSETMPRDASFLLSPNRLNVAVSRARCLAVVVASPGLLDLPARSIEEMRLANLLCRAAEVGHVASQA